uniref:Putative ovule protein n=1 Tax=Solanum chacoense TaxID=4108 RepID=A0A0V0GF02_SOLCH
MFLIHHNPWNTIVVLCNFLCVPYRHAHLCFHNSYHMKMDVMCKIHWWTLFLGFISHHLLKTLITGSLL